MRSPRFRALRTTTILVALVLTLVVAGGAITSWKPAQAGAMLDGYGGAHVQWIRICGTESMIRQLGRGGLYLRVAETDQPLPALAIVDVRLDDGCVAYLAESPAFPPVAWGERPPTQTLDVQHLTAGQPMFDSAVRTARARVGLTAPQTADLAVPVLARRFPGEYAAWRCALGDDGDFWLYLLASGKVVGHDSEGDRHLRATGAYFWDARRRADLSFATGRCR